MDAVTQSKKWKEKIRTCLISADLTEFEETFLRSISLYLDRVGTLSINQSNLLDKIYEERVGRNDR
jgi:hypothetical protein